MKILVAVDSSQYSEKAVAKAVELAQKGGAELIALAVAEQPLDMGEIAVPVDLSVHYEAVAAKALEKAVDIAKSKGMALRSVLEGGSSPADNIIELAKKEGVDLIVTGSRGRTGLEKFLLGSVAAKVVSHAACSVLVVR
ncbi:universal stress protein [Nitratidesulfovibrio termitidis]|uniref:universal stress protein n=1 Tax=Nitratidesulfovibrio termitidis TaxID=42252 RepID=UPI00040F90F3|nr:universal stress protein [Nitratidesulfovibrio termitidis]